MFRSNDAASAQVGRRDVSRCSRWYTISACSDHSEWFSTVSRRLSVATSESDEGAGSDVRQHRKTYKESEWATETVLHVHDHLVSAIGSQKLPICHVFASLIFLSL